MFEGGVIIKNQEEREVEDYYHHYFSKGMQDGLELVMIFVYSLVDYFILTEYFL